MTDAEQRERLHRLSAYEAAKRAYENAAENENNIRELWKEADDLKKEARFKMKVAENELLGRNPKHG